MKSSHHGSKVCLYDYYYSYVYFAGFNITMGMVIMRILYDFAMSTINVTNKKNVFINAVGL